ncbi:MAG: DUF4253 domain-containing protein [Acidimicrobiia bacterium]
MGMDDITARVSLLAMQGMQVDEIGRQLGISIAEVEAALERSAEFSRSLDLPALPPEFFAVEPQPLRADALLRTEPRRFTSQSAGTLPDDGPAVVGGVELPIGRRKRSVASEELVLWITDEPVMETGPVWLALVNAFEATGLWPIVTTGLFDASERPWDTGEFHPRSVDGVDVARAAELLRRGWDGGVPDEEEEIVDEIVGPFGPEFPGLTPAPLAYGQLAIDQVASAFAPRRIALVAAWRPGDVITRLGWLGAENVTQDVAGISSVLRSWEDRFGAVLAAMSWDSIVLAVQGVPGTVAESLPIAAEHFAFCPDQIERGLGSVRAHAEAITNAVFWRFWLD